MITEVLVTKENCRQIMYRRLVRCSKCGVKFWIGDVIYYKEGSPTNIKYHKDYRPFSWLE